MSFTATNGRVIVKPTLETKTESGIEVPFQEKIGVGTVVSVGADIKDINVGDGVYHSLAYDEMYVDGDEYRVLYVEDIYAIVEKS